MGGEAASQPVPRLAIGLRRRRNLFLAFTLLALIPRLIVLDIVLHRERPVYNFQDSSGYIMPATHLIDGTGFQGGGGFPAFWWPPGYSGFLAILFATGVASFDHLAGALIVQCILSSMIVGMASLIALDLGGVAVALIAGGLMVLEPSSIAYANVILAETVFTFLLLLAVLTWGWWWDQPRLYRLLGLACIMGIMPLVRPVATYMWVPVTLLMIFVRPPSARRAMLAAFVIVATLPVAAWTMRNYSYLHVPIFATVGQFNEARFARDVEKMAGVPASPQTPYKQPWEEGFGPDQGLSFAQLVKVREEYLRKVVFTHPVATAERLALTGAAMIGVPDSRLPDLVIREVPALEGGSVLVRLKWLLRLGWVWPLLLLGMSVSVGGVLSVPVLLIAARTWPRKQQGLLLLIVLLVFYQLLLSSCIMFQAERYRVPTIPLLAVMLACGVAGLRRSYNMVRDDG